MKKDIMIDLETMAHGSNSAIVQIGAVLFNRETREASVNFFKANVCLQSCIERGLRVDGGTVQWWMDKPDGQRKGLYVPQPQHLTIVLQNFTQWLSTCAAAFNLEVSDLHLWGRSPRFDVGILLDAYRACGLIAPWDIRKELDVRTIEALAPEVKKRHDKENVHSYQHDSVTDCMHQIAYVSEIWQKVQRGFQETIGNA